MHWALGNSVLVIATKETKSQFSVHVLGNCELSLRLVWLKVLSVIFGAQSRLLRWMVRSLGVFRDFFFLSLGHASSVRTAGFMTWHYSAFNSFWTPVHEHWEGLFVVFAPLLSVPDCCQTTIPDVSMFQAKYSVRHQRLWQLQKMVLFKGLANTHTYTKNPQI